MNVKKAIKKIAALAAGTTMVTATIVGAMAYDLSDYPAPFVQNGVFNGKIVVGQQAKVSDVLGAIDIAASLQAAAKVPVSTSGATETVSVQGGVEIKSNSEDFNWGDRLDDFNQGKYDDDDFPELLKSGTVEDESDGKEYDYDQYIQVGNATLDFNVERDYFGDDPAFFLDFRPSGAGDLVFTVDFDDTVDLTAFQDSERITMFGKSFTFDPNNAVGDDLVLYGSDSTVYVDKDSPVTVNVDGEEYTLEVVGGNSDNSEVILKVTGPSGTETKTLKSGDSRKVAGLDLFVDDVFISNIGDASVAASVFVGSDKIEIPSTAYGTTASYQEVTIDGEDNTDVYAWVEGSNFNATDKIHFKVNPKDFERPDSNKDWDLLGVGESWTDPLFGFSIAFEGLTPELENGRNKLSLVRSGDAYNLEFMNNDGDEYNIELYQNPNPDSNPDIQLGEDLVLGATTLFEDNIFILDDNASKTGDSVTEVYEVRNIDASSTPAIVTLKELGSGTTKDYKVGDEIGSTGVTISAINAGTPDNFTLSQASQTRVIAKGGLLLQLDTNLTDGANLTITEDQDDLDEVASPDTLSFVVTDPGASADEDIELTSASWGSGVQVNDRDGNVRYGFSPYGTWFKEEIDNNGDYLDVYYSEQETDFHIFLNGPEAVVVKSASSSDTGAYQINKLVVGQIAVYDDEAMSLLGNTPLIVVGGPCVNTVAMELMGNPQNCAEGFTEGKAKIKFFSDKNALLVAGYSGQDTRGASYVLADYDKYDLSGDEVEVVVTSLDQLSVNKVE